jgi:Xaa-Pro aminopeptidase
MENNQKEILTKSISGKELERRWKSVRERMREESLDCLIMQNDNEWLGGYAKWFTDLPATNGHSFTVIFPIDDEMTTITHGGTPPGDMGPPAWTMRGVKARLTAPYFRSMWYSAVYDAELAVKALRSMRANRVGIVGKASMSAAFYEYLVKNLSDVIFAEVSDLVDRIKAIKSDEEITLIRDVAAIQDEAMEYAKKIILPGRRDYEIVADIIHKVTELGSEEQLVFGGSGPIGQPVGIRKRHFQNRMIREGDQFSLMIEVNGPGGMYAESGRIFFVGKVPSKIYDAFELAKEAQDETLKLMRPGADPVDIWKANNDFMAAHGVLPETRLFAHGQGYDLVERPAIRDDESMKIQSRMNFAVHPTIGTDEIWIWVCDNYLITESGSIERLHKTPREVFSV